MTTFNFNNVDYTITDNGYYYKTVNGKKSRISKAEFEAAIETIKAYWMATMAITETRKQMDEAWATEEGMKDLMDWYEGEKEAGLTEEDMQEAILATAVQEAEESANTEAGEEIAAKMMGEEIDMEQKLETEARMLEEHVGKKAPKAKKERKPRKSKDIAYEGHGVTLTAKQVDFIKHLPDTYFWENGVESIIWVDCLCDDIHGQFANKPMTVGAMISTLCEKGLGTRATSRRDGRKCTSFALTEMGQAVAIDLGL